MLSSEMYKGENCREAEGPGLPGRPQVSTLVQGTMGFRLHNCNSHAGSTDSKLLSKPPE